MSDHEQTALDYLNNWRDAQVKNVELEAKLEKAISLVVRYGGLSEKWMREQLEGGE